MPQGSVGNSARRGFMFSQGRTFSALQPDHKLPPTGDHVWAAKPSCQVKDNTLAEMGRKERGICSTILAPNKLGRVSPNLPRQVSLSPFVTNNWKTNKASVCPSESSQLRSQTLDSAHKPASNPRARPLSRAAQSVVQQNAPTSRKTRKGETRGDKYNYG